MFSSFMVNAWIVGSVVAVVAGVIGFFTVLRGAAFVAHAIPNGSFAGAAGAALVGANTLVGLGVFSLLGAWGIGWMSRRGRRDVATALTLTFMLGLGALFISLTSRNSSAVYSVLFGEVLGISDNQVAPTLALAGVSIVAIALIYQPLLLSSVLPDVGEARGISQGRIDLLFLTVVALATTMTVPVVGTLLIFSLMIGAPAAARSFTDRPAVAIALSVAISLATVWIAIAVSYNTNYPIGFFVGVISALSYTAGRIWASWRRRRAPARASLVAA